MSTEVDKQTLRKVYKAKRLALLPEEKQALDNALLTSLKELDFTAVSYLHIFLPIIKWNEFDTLPFIHWLRQHQPDLHIVVSESNLEEGTLQHYIWNDEAVVENAWGIPELIVQSHTVPVEPKEIDAVLMPLLVCDRIGNRIGYGKGFYDRFLQACRPDVRKIGVSYFEPLAALIPADSWDIPLTNLITPRGTIFF